MPLLGVASRTVTLSIPGPVETRLVSDGVRAGEMISSGRNKRFR
jgi:hypothetical protein